VGSAAWFAWLETASSFSFVSETGRFTARREQSGHKRGGWYWKAYRKQHGKLSSRYLGKSETLTLARLQAVAQALAAPPVEACYGGVIHTAPHTASSAEHTTRAVSSNPLLATKLHMPRPRSQLVPRTSVMGDEQAASVPGTAASLAAPMPDTPFVAFSMCSLQTSELG